MRGDSPNFVAFVAIIIWCSLSFVFIFFVATDIGRKKLDESSGRQSTGAQIPKEESWWDLLEEWHDLEKAHASYKDDSIVAKDMKERQRTIVDQNAFKNLDGVSGGCPARSQRFFSQASAEQTIR